MSATSPSSGLTCPQCGLKVSLDTILCPRDGTLLNSQVTQPQLRPVTQEIDRERPTQPRSAASLEELQPVVEGGAWERTVIRDLMVGRKIGDYEIKKRIGNGGMGIVYEGLQKEIGRKVAIKIIRPDWIEPSGGGLLDEARAAVAVRHRGIIDIFNFGRLDGVGQYIVMEFLEGESLEHLLERQPLLPFEDVADTLEQVLGALVAAHSVGVIHRDLKPSNIFLVRETGGGQYVKVLDFGLARRARPGERAVRQSQVMGTPEFMAPEQATGAPVDARTDLYAVGCIAYLMLTGRVPFAGQTPVEIAVRQVNDPAPDPRVLRPSLPPELAAWVLELMSKKPDARPSSAELARNGLRRAVRSRGADHTQENTPVPDREQPTAKMSGAPPTDVLSVRLEPQRSIVPWVGLAAIAVAVALATIAWSFFGEEPRQVAVVTELPTGQEPAIRAPPVPTPPVVPETQPASAPAPAVQVQPAQPVKAPTAVRPKGSSPEPVAAAPTPAIKPGGPLQRLRERRRLEGAVAPAATQGTLKVVVHDGYADLKIDGVDQPIKTPLALAAGKHRLELVNRAGNAHHTETFEVVGGVNEVKHFDVVRTGGATRIEPSRGPRR